MIADRSRTYYSILAFNLLYLLDTTITKYYKAVVPPLREEKKFRCKQTRFVAASNFWQSVDNRRHSIASGFC